MNTKQQIQSLKREMKERGIRKVSHMNGGLTPDEYRYNSQLFQLERRHQREVRDNVTALDFTLTCECGKTIRIHCMDTDWDPIACPFKCGSLYGLSRGTGHEYKMILLSSPTIQMNVMDTGS